MENVVEQVVKAGQGFGDVEVSLVSMSETAAIHEEKHAKRFVSGELASLNIRVTKGKRTGFSTTTDVFAWKAALLRAQKIAKLSKPLELSPQLPGRQKYPDAHCFSRKISRISPQTLADSLERFVSSVNGVKVDSAQIAKVESKVIFANSNGVFEKNLSNTMGCGISVFSEQATAQEGHVSHKPFDPSKYAERASELCILASNIDRINAGRTSVVFDYFAFSSLVEGILSPSLSADRVQNHESFMEGKVGKRVANPNLNVVDDGTWKPGLVSCRFDAEGVRMQKKELVRNGVLIGFMYDSYSALKEGKQSTGNCISLAGRPLVGPTNFIVLPGDWKNDEIFKDTRNGVYARTITGSFTANAITGNVAVGIDNGFEIKNGKIMHAIKGALLSFNFFEALNRISAVGKTLRQESISALPLIRIDGIQLIA